MDMDYSQSTTGEELLRNSFNKRAAHTALAAFAAAAICFTTGKMGINPLFTSVAKTTEELKNHDFTPIEVGGYGGSACKDSELWRTHFRAKNAKGDMVTGTMCEEIFKDPTLSF